MHPSDIAKWCPFRLDRALNDLLEISENDIAQAWVKFRCVARLIFIMIRHGGKFPCADYGFDSLRQKRYIDSAKRKYSSLRNSNRFYFATL